jgi:hypothetical protein
METTQLFAIDGNSSSNNLVDSQERLKSRRDMIIQSFTTVAGVAALTSATPSPVWASGGATAGKYTYVFTFSY